MTRPNFFCGIDSLKYILEMEYEDNYSPVLSMEEKEAIRITREFIDQFMNDENTSCVDFTDYPSLHA